MNKLPKKRISRLKTIQGTASGFPTETCTTVDTDPTSTLSLTTTGLQQK